MIGLLIGTSVYFFFAIGLFQILKNRKPKKIQDIKTDMFTMSGIIYSENNTYLEEGQIAFHKNGTITLTIQGGEKTIATKSIKSLKIPVTASLATSHIHIQSSDGDFRIFNDVTKKMLLRKVGSTALQHTSTLPVADVDSIQLNSLQAKPSINPYYTSDNLILLHQWLKFNKFPHYKAQIDGSDLTGFVFIMLLPTMILLGIWFETISKMITGDMSAGSAVMGWVVVVSLLCVVITRIYSTNSLKKKLEAASRNKV